MFLKTWVSFYLRESKKLLKQCCLSTVFFSPALAALQVFLAACGYPEDRDVMQLWKYLLQKPF